MSIYADVGVLTNELQAKNRTAFTYLYDNYSAALYGVIRKIVIDETTASDILQDVFTKIWLKIESYNREKGSLYTWLLNVARNTAIDHLRKSERRVIIQSDEDSVYQNVATNQPNTDSIGLRQIIDKLKPDLKEMIDLHYFAGMTHQEISDQKQMPLGTVKTKIRTGMQQLKNIFLSLFF
jgi:RNA polymerase sigma factor (sigma-70 family)